mmetsp:Transcript_70962/g.129896  ORF Transcript_70962/g.129896 Transcript_70962/m.129896 type:complete len:317 (+) Transcript_70962:72-1022(+)
MPGVEAGSALQDELVRDQLRRLLSQDHVGYLSPARTSPAVSARKNGSPSRPQKFQHPQTHYKGPAAAAQDCRQDSPKKLRELHAHHSKTPKRQKPNKDLSKTASSSFDEDARRTKSFSLPTLPTASQLPNMTPKQTLPSSADAPAHRPGMRPQKVSSGGNALQALLAAARREVSFDDRERRVPREQSKHLPSLQSDMPPRRLSNASTASCSSQELRKGSKHSQDPREIAKPKERRRSGWSTEEESRRLAEQLKNLGKPVDPFAWQSAELENKWLRRQAATEMLKASLFPNAAEAAPSVEVVGRPPLVQSSSTGLLT